MLRSLSMAAVATLALGCTANPLLAPGQSKLIRMEEKALKSQSALIQTRISEAGTSQALVVISKDSPLPSAVVAGTDPYSAARQVLPAVNSGVDCIVVFRRDWPVRPQHLDCGQLSKEVSVETALQELRERVASLDAALMREQDVLHSIQADQKDQQGLIGTIMKVTSLQNIQLSSLKQSLSTLIDAYKKTSETVGANNKQLDSMVSDLNGAFELVQQQLDQISQRLATIK
jgi:hypothetical protein